MNLTTMTETSVLTLQEEINKPTLRKLQELNRDVQVFRLGPSKNQLEITPNYKFDLKPLFSGSVSIVNNYDIICSLNPDLVLELYGTQFLIKQMSGISGQIEVRIASQLEAIIGVGPGKVGSVSSGSVEFMINPVNFRRPDVAWVSAATKLAIQPPPGQTRYNGVPDLVVEIRSPSQSQMSQRNKIGEWITAGVDFGILVDCIGSVTFCYATAASGILPAIGTVNATGGTAHAHPNILYTGTIVEETFNWPLPLPAPVGGDQFGPALNVPIPAGTAFGIATGGVVNNINHANFELS